MNINYLSASEAVRKIGSGSRVFIQGGAATPVPLVLSLLNRHDEVKDIELVSITSLGNIDFTKEEYRKSFYMNSLFVSENTREVVNGPFGDYVPVFLSEIPILFRKMFLTLGVNLPVKPGFMDFSCLSPESQLSFY